MDRFEETGLLEDAERRSRDLAMACNRAVLFEVVSIIVFANDAAARLLGAACSTEAVGHLARYIFALVAGGMERRSGGKGVVLDSRITRFNQSVLSVRMALLPCTYGGRYGIQILIRDNKRQRLEVQLRFLVQHDTLTVLPNRTEFRDRLDDAMTQAKRKVRHVAVMAVSTHHVKAIKTRCGVAVAGQVLREVARPLTLSIREADTVARLVGGELGVILEAVEQCEHAAVGAN